MGQYQVRTAVGADAAKTQYYFPMFFDWPVFKRHKREPATLKAIFVATSEGEPMRSVDATEAITNRGLKGDRYSEDRGHWKSIDGCQVTLISESDLEQAKNRAAGKFQHSLENGGHRRNLVIAALKTKSLEGKKFRIGDAVFGYHKLRPPCAYLDQISGDGLSRALGRHSGVCLRVVSGGKLNVGDTVEIIDPT